MLDPVMAPYTDLIAFWLLLGIKTKSVHLKLRSQIYFKTISWAYHRSDLEASEMSGEGMICSLTHLEVGVKYKEGAASSGCNSLIVGVGSMG